MRRGVAVGCRRPGFVTASFSSCATCGRACRGMRGLRIFRSAYSLPAAGPRPRPVPHAPGRSPGPSCRACRGTDPRDHLGAHFGGLASCGQKHHDPVHDPPLDDAALVRSQPVSQPCCRRIDPRRRPCSASRRSRGALASSRPRVYGHAEELGVVRLGDVPRPRLRFEPATIAEARSAGGDGTMRDRRWGQEPPASTCCRSSRPRAPDDGVP